MDHGVPGALGLHALQRATGERDRGSEPAHLLNKEDNLVRERQLRQRTAELRIAQVRLIFQSMNLNNHPLSRRSMARVGRVEHVLGILRLRISKPRPSLHCARLQRQAL